MTTITPFPERDPEELLTLSEVAEILKVPINTLRWWRQLGTGPEFFKIGRHLVTTVVAALAGGGAAVPTPAQGSLHAPRQARAVPPRAPRRARGGRGGRCGGRGTRSSERARSG